MFFLPEAQGSVRSVAAPVPAVVRGRQHDIETGFCQGVTHFLRGAEQRICADLRIVVDEDRFLVDHAYVMSGHDTAHVCVYRREIPASVLLPELGVYGFMYQVVSKGTERHFARIRQFVRGAGMDRHFRQGSRIFFWRKLRCAGRKQKQGGG